MRRIDCRWLVVALGAMGIGLGCGGSESRGGDDGAEKKDGGAEEAGSPAAGGAGGRSSGDGGKAGSSSSGGASNGGTPGAAGGTPGGGSGGGPAGSITLADLPEELAKVVCATQESCVGPFLPFFLNGQNCVDYAQNQVNEKSFGLLADAVEADRVSYDGTLARACLDALGGLGCASSERRTDVLCPGLFTGTQESGQACAIDEECVPGLFCNDIGTCPGACAPRLNVGATCGGSDDCKDGLRCPDGTRTCTAGAGPGEPCEGGNAPPCRSDLTCVGDQATAPGVCKVLLDLLTGEVGETCDLDAGVYCKAPLGCALVEVDGVGTDAGATPVWRCEARTTNTACHIAFPESCPDGEYCRVPAGVVEGTCTPKPSAGRPCGKPAERGEATICDVDSVCIGGTCAPLQRIGGACTSETQCLSGFCVGNRCGRTTCGPTE